MKTSVTFNSAGQTLAGDLYLPDGYVDGTQLPGVVVTGAWTTVKEQMAGTYAAQLADRGFAALAFDFRGWGASPDDVPYLENPTRKTQDIEAAVEYLASRPEVLVDRIGGLGVCASSGYMSDAALNSKWIKSVALVAPWLHDKTIVNDVYGGESGVAALIAAGRDAERAPNPVILEAASLTNEQAVMYQAPYYTDPSTGLVPEYDNQFNAASWEGWLTYDAMVTAKLTSQPTLLVHSEAAAIPQGARQYAELLGDKATTRWLDNVTQFDFYSEPEAVQTASDAVAAHFTKTLTQSGEK
ncbi:MAG: alpha/beta fold hydrolase [Pseudomonadota bacterium]